MQRAESMAMPYFISLGLLFAKEPVGLGGCFFAAEHLLGVHRLQDVLEALAGVGVRLGLADVDVAGVGTMAGI